MSAGHRSPYRSPLASRVTLNLTTTMKRHIIGAIGALFLAACASAPYMVSTEGALERTAIRVVERHDLYVSLDDSLDDAAEAEALADSAALTALVQLPQVSGSILLEALDPVAERHDAYVLVWESDVLFQDTYLEDTARLRSLLAEAASHEPKR